MKKKILLFLYFDNNISQLVNFVNNIDNTVEIDILIVDDGSSKDQYDKITLIRKIFYIKHEEFLGYGASFLSALGFSKSFDYDILISYDLNASWENFNLLLENLNYGFDVVSISRTLENYNHKNFSEGYVENILKLSNKINEITGFNITDPLSKIKAYNLNSITEFELTEFDFSIFIQIWIQSAFYGLNIIELPMTDADIIEDEIITEEFFLQRLLAFSETEKFLYTIQGREN
jgi:hypothetical protein